MKNHFSNAIRSYANKRTAGKLFPTTLILVLLAAGFLAAPAPSRASIAIGISVGVAPPPIPVYTQPVCPGPGYMWTPGYWNYDPVQGYYWVPGTWIMPPAAGLLWTPGYWGWSGAAFIFHAGYWGPHVGFYGGINYGFGYPGVGFVGGEWRGGAFFYNRAVVNLGPGHFSNVYYHAVPIERGVSRVSFNGGRGGIVAHPTAGELAAGRDRHLEATATQRNHEIAAHNERAQYASANHGRPGVMSSSRAGDFRGSASNRTMTTAHSNSAQSHGSSYRPSGASTGRGAPASHNETGRGSTSHQAESHPAHSGGESHKSGSKGR